MSVRRRNAVMEDVATVFLQEGKVLSRGEYDRLPNVPLRTAHILKQFGSWPRMITIMESAMPEVFEELRNNPPEIEKGEYDPLQALANRTVSKTF